MQAGQFQYGMIGLGTMGRNLALNMSDHGFSVAGFDKNGAQVELFNKEKGERNISATTDLEQFVQSLKTPRSIILLVPAGKIVDEVINELVPLLSKDDLLLDCGNSHFTDTDARAQRLKNTGIHFMGVGVSGGEEGARHGPSIMPGGPPEAYHHVADLFSAVAAKVNNEPCVAWLGPGSAGHYVKMVHNGIEYALMQLISETYHLLKEVGRLDNNELFITFRDWNKGKLQSFLVEITASIFTQQDTMTDQFLVDVILDAAHQKGTGGWTSEDGINLQVPIPVIDLAVSMRDLSAKKNVRMQAMQKLKGPDAKFPIEKEELKSVLEDALYFSMITAYAQGMELLQAASRAYQYNLQPAVIAGIWRGGCIIRSSMLEDIRAVFTHEPDLPTILLGDHFADLLAKQQPALRKVVRIGAETGIPVPALMASLAYYDSYRSGWLPANLIQAQRDLFGAHTYERTDREGIFHTHWNQEK